MKKALMIPFAIVALGAAPLSYAQSNDYLAQRQNMDSAGQVRAAWQEAVAQGEQARAKGMDQGQPRDYLAERQDLDQGAAIAAGYRELRVQQEVVKAEGNAEGARRDYLNERQSLDTQDHIRRALDGSGQS